MRRVNIDSVRNDAKLARTIFNSEGGVLLTKGVTINESYIYRLREYGINEIYIDDLMSSGITVTDVVEDKTRKDSEVLVKKTMLNYSFSDSLDVEAVKRTVNKIIDELLSNRDIIYNLAEIRKVDDYTFEHSVNVCILSLITGIGLGFNIDRLRELGTGALLHDIGKLFIPKSILLKPTHLTVDEFETIKKHTVLGYDALKNSGKVNLTTAYIAFGHHERYDGSGYPLQLKSDNIQIYARIVAVADVYDALTSDRVYRKRLKPCEVYEYITSLSINHFDPKVIDSFVKYVTVYPVGTGVMLNTKERALVVRNNRHTPTRPVIRIVNDEYFKKVKSFKEIDLSEQSSIFIVDSCEI